MRAAAAVVGIEEVIVIGSQATHAFMETDIPRVALQSVEADIAFRDDPDGALADLVDGSIGEASLFHQTFGFYAQGVSIDTAILPPGWQARLIRFETPATNGIVAWCLSPEDLWVSKALAARPKDLAFCRDLLKRGLVNRAIAGAMLDSVEVAEAKRILAKSLLASTSGS